MQLKLIQAVAFDKTVPIGSILESGYFRTFKKVAEKIQIE